MNKQTEHQEFQHMPLGQLRPSGTNPRKNTSAVALRELTASVKQHGVLEPLLARPVDGHFEIIAGERRFKAAKAAGLEMVPVRVMEMTDAEALEAQLVENLQREDVHPLDEGLGYRRLMKNYDVPAIAAKVNKSTSYVYQRVKLADLTKEVQEFFQADRITAGHAVLIARLQPKGQEAALRKCFPNVWGAHRITKDADCIGVRALSRWIQEDLYLNLRTAPFNLDDPMLVPKAGPCVACPKCTTNSPELYEDIGKKNVCTDPACFKSKFEAHITLRRRELGNTLNKRLILLGSYGVYRPEERKAGMLDQSDWVKADKKKCAHTKTGLVITGDDKGKEFPVCPNAKCSIHHPHTRLVRSTPSVAELRSKNDLEEKAAIRRCVFKLTVRKASASLKRKDLELIARKFFSCAPYETQKEILQLWGWKEGKKTLWYGADYKRPVAAGLAKLPHVSGFLISLALCGELNNPAHKDQDLNTVAKRYRLNVAKIARGVRTELRVQRKAQAKRTALVARKKKLAAQAKANVKAKKPTSTWKDKVHELHTSAKRRSKKPVPKKR